MAKTQLQLQLQLQFNSSRYLPVDTGFQSFIHSLFSAVEHACIHTYMHTVLYTHYSVPLDTSVIIKYLPYTHTYTHTPVRTLRYVLYTYYSVPLYTSMIIKYLPYTHTYTHIPVRTFYTLITQCHWTCMHTCIHTHIHTHTYQYVSFIHSLLSALGYQCDTHMAGYWTGTESVRYSVQWQLFLF